jgi:hypothetical protein
MMPKSTYQILQLQNSTLAIDISHMNQFLTIRDLGLTLSQPVTGI